MKLGRGVSYISAVTPEYVKTAGVEPQIIVAVKGSILIKFATPAVNV